VKTMSKTKKKEEKRKKKTFKPKGYEIKREKGGRGYWAIVRSNTYEEMNDLLNEMQKDAVDMGLEQVEVISVQPSPAGGWEATIRAHNWNPIKSIKRAYEKVKQPITTRRAAKAWEGRERERYKDVVRQRLESDPSLYPGFANLPVYLQDKALETYIRGEEKSFEQKEQAAKYGVPIHAESRTIVIERPDIDPATGKPKRDKEGNIIMEQVRETIPGRSYSQVELTRKIQRAKETAPKSKKRLAAEALVHGSKQALITGGMVTAQGIGTAQSSTGLGRNAFRRGAQTFGSGPMGGSTGSGEGIYRAAPRTGFGGPNPVGDQSIMRQAVLPRVGNPFGGFSPPSPLSDELRRR